MNTMRQFRQFTFACQLSQKNIHLPAIISGSVKGAKRVSIQRTKEIVILTTGTSIGVGDFENSPKIKTAKYWHTLYKA